MAKVIITGRCGGTQVRSAKGSGKPYSITRFSEVPSQSQVDLFGDFQLPPSDEVKEYVFEAGIGQLQFPQLVSVSPVVSPAPKK